MVVGVAASSSSSFAVQVTAVQMSGATLAEVDIGLEETPAMLCERISGQGSGKTAGWCQVIPAFFKNQPI